MPVVIAQWLLTSVDNYSAVGVDDFFEVPVILPIYYTDFFVLFARLPVEVVTDELLDSDLLLACACGILGFHSILLFQLYFGCYTDIDVPQFRPTTRTRSPLKLPRCLFQHFVAAATMNA